MNRFFSFLFFLTSIKGYTKVIWAKKQTNKKHIEHMVIAFLKELLSGEILNVTIGPCWHNTLRTQLSVKHLHI